MVPESFQQVASCPIPGFGQCTLVIVRVYIYIYTHTHIYIYIYKCIVTVGASIRGTLTVLLMIEILHYLMDPNLWELVYVPCYGLCRI